MDKKLVTCSAFKLIMGFEALTREDRQALKKRKYGLKKKRKWKKENKSGADTSLIFQS
jgi:hypothetical protein